MTTIGYHCSHEQFSPRKLLDCVQRAEQAGFDAIYLHNVGRNQRRFISAFQERVLPQLHRSQ